ncbi:MAG: proprotein convertase P-domain-containing protein [Acidobacteria bacterium]|nr:proprotein convertase P-domain-containing protein [Acidobacteriota bacterium]
MFKNLKRTLLSLAVLLAVFGVARPATSATFPANAPSLGAIPDGTAGTPPAYGAARDVTFTVSGMIGSPTALSVSLNATHTWLGDLEVTLIAPNGANLLLFARTGATTATGVGDSSDLAGANTLVFVDTATTNWWTAAATATAAVAMPADNYRTTAAGGAGQVNPAPVTSLNTAFAGVSNVNGTWTLRFRDGASSDTGSVTAASLTLTTGIGHAKHVDFTGDGRSDFAIVRPTGGAGTWWIGDAASSSFTTLVFGATATDFFVPADYDGDGKVDAAIWRPGPAGTAAFWILPSSTGIAYSVQFGQTNDEATVVADYDGDGKADPAVYRPGATVGAQSTWYYKSSLTGLVVAVPWGVNGDFPVPGDYDGDGKADFAVQRDVVGQGVFWIKQSTAGVVSVAWGLGSDFTVPGDYDGDGKTDVAVSRTVSGARQYWIRRSSDLGTTFQNWGITGDLRVPGDYDGDGKTDFAIWRPSATPGQTAFWVNLSTGGVLIRQWGQGGVSSDYPVAAWIVH